MSGAGEASNRAGLMVAASALGLLSIFLLANLKRTEIPFVAVGSIAFAWSVFVVVIARRERLRNAGLVCAAIFLSLALTEYAAYRFVQFRYLDIKNHGIWRQADIGMGLVNVPNATAESKEYFHKQLVFDALYQIDGSGNRKIPSSVQGGPNEAVFFGCSYMFGHGLNNDQTIPYFFARDAHGTFAAYNFSAHGWGAHQMLRELETGLVTRITGHPQLAFYEGLTDHIKRAATGAYEPFGPRYEFDGDGSVNYVGPFHGLYYKMVLQYLYKNWTFHLIQNDFLRSEPNASQISLYVAIMKKTRDLLEQNGTRLIVVYWDKGQLAQTVIRALRRKGFEVIRVSDIIPDFARDPTKYELSPFDDHPSAEANQLIGEYLWRQYGEPLLANSKDTVAADPPAHDRDDPKNALAPSHGSDH